MSTFSFSKRGIVTVAVLLSVALVPAAICQDDAASVGCPTAPSNGAAPICVNTYHNQNSRKGQNTKEQTLTKTNIQNKGLTSFTYSVTGQVYAQPLFLPAVQIGTQVHNEVFVATETNDVYAFDGDSSSANGGNPYWHVNLTTPPSQGSRVNVANTDLGCANIQPNIGITGTPVINITSSTSGQISGGNIFVVARSKSGTTFYQTLYALNAITGATIAWSDIPTSVSGTSDTFDPRYENQRGALLYQSGQVYISWGSHCDGNNLHPLNANWHGWLMAFKLQNGAFQAPVGWVVSSLPEAGIWESGSGPAGDGTNIFFSTGNGSTTAAPFYTENPCTGCYGNSIVKVSGPTNNEFMVLDYFTPKDHPFRFCNDYDVGSGGVVLLPGTAFSPSNMLVQAGKNGNLYLLNMATGQMGLYGGTTGQFGCIPAPVTTGSDNIVYPIYGDLCTTVSGDTSNECGVQGSPVFWNNNVFFGPRCQAIKQYNLKNGTNPNPNYNVIMQAGVSSSVGGTTTSSCNSSAGASVFPYPGAALAISQYTGGAILWALDNTHFAFSQSPAPPVLYAYDAATLANIPLSSTSAGLNAGTGSAIKFAVPTIANGKVYVGNQNQVVVFSLNP
jgi:hypothetical protein